MAKKRIALTVPPEIDSVLSDLSKLTNTPKTAIILELLADVLPSLHQVVNSIKQIKEGQKELAVQGMVELLGKATMAANQAHLELGEMKGEILGKK